MQTRNENTIFIISKLFTFFIFNLALFKNSTLILYSSNSVY